MHPKTADEIVAVVLLDIAVIVLIARGMGILARRLGQPAVVGEIVAGLALGPSLLGLLPGNPSVALFPMVVRPFLNVVAQLGLVIFMFIVGLELDLSLVRGRERIVSTISLSSIALPFGLGLGLAAFIYQDHKDVAGRVVTFWPFALFVGVSMAITAFPVLARILTERGMQRIDVGAIALACASVDDVMAWTILAVVVAVVTSTGLVGAPRTMGEAIAFVLVMFFVVKPLLRRVAAAYQRAKRLTPNILAVLIAGFLGSAFVTGWIGLHVIFGAFVFGVVVPREQTADMFREILERLEQVSLLLLLPVFFVVTGLGADVTKLGPNGLLVLLGVLLVAVIGKFVGATTAAFVQGLGGRKSRAIGVLMNSRGLTQLVVLNVGVSLKVLDESLFTILVLMAIVTTIMTGPLLKMVYPQEVLEREIAEAERAGMGLVDAYRVVAAVDDPKRSQSLIDVGAALLAGDDSAELVLSRFVESGQLQVASGLALDLVEVASGLADMQALSTRLQAGGVNAIVRSQATDDLVHSLTTQIDAIRGNVLLCGAELHSRASLVSAADLLVEQAPCTVAVLTDPQGVGVQRGQIVEVRPGRGVDGDLALELAIRAAKGLGSRLVLTTSEDRRQARQLDHLAQSLAGAGMLVEVSHSPGGSLSATAGYPSLTVVGSSGLSSTEEVLPSARALSEGARGPVLLVHAAKSDSDDGLTRLVERLRTQATSSGSDTTPAGPAGTGGDREAPVLSPRHTEP